jgi:hypothetical protein
MGLVAFAMQKFIARLSFCFLYRFSGASAGELNAKPTPVIARSDSDEAIHAAASEEMDCFAEPVIGRAFARPVGSQ